MASRKNTGPAYESPRPRQLEPYDNDYPDRLNWDVGVTVEQIGRKYAASVERWRSSIFGKILEEFFERAILRQTFVINQAICIGLGSFATTANAPYYVPDYYPAADNIFSQFVAFEHWIELLRTRHEIGPIYFQDPEFVAVDKQFLESRGYTVLDAREGQALTLMTSETFLFAPIGHVKVLTLAQLQEAFPPLLIGNIIDGERRHAEGNQPPLVEKKVDPRLTSWRPEDRKTIDLRLTSWNRFKGTHEVYDRVVEARKFVYPFLDQRVYHHLLRVAPTKEYLKLLESDNAFFIWLWMWVYYVPDNKNRLGVPLNIGEDFQCVCEYCQRKGADVQGPLMYSPTHWNNEPPQATQQNLDTQPKSPNTATPDIQYPILPETKTQAAQQNSDTQPESPDAATPHIQYPILPETKTQAAQQNLDTQPESLNTVTPDIQTPILPETKTQNTGTAPAPAPVNTSNQPRGWGALASGYIG